MDQVRTSSGLFPILSLIPREREREIAAKDVATREARGVQAPLFKNTILMGFQKQSGLWIKYCV